MSLIFTVEQKKVDSCSLIKRDPLHKRTLYIFIFLQVLWFSSFGQTKISGLVKNEKGEPLSGVSVNFKQTSIGSTTDQNGKYAVNFRSKGILVFTSIGYLKQEINVNGRTSIDVVLVSQANSLNEVTVVGYGTQKKTSLTSAVADIKGEDLNKRSVADATQALQGLAPGVTVTDQGGGPGQSQVSIRVRGITTLSGNDPLIMVDGIEQSLNDINPSDIETLTVLKDAASTAIYGSRAANGVVLVTTKRAKSGKLSVNLNSYYAIQKAVYFPKQMGMADYMHMQNEAYVNAGKPAPFPEDTITTWVNSTDRIKYPLVNDWINVMFSPAPQQNHTLSVSGGTDRMKTLLAVNFFDQDGIIHNSHSQRPSIRLNTDFKVSDKITLSGDFNYRLKNYRAPTYEENAIKYMWASSNFAVPRYPDGTYGLSSDGISPLVQSDLRGISHFKDNFGFANLKANIEILKGLKFQTQYGLTLHGLSQKIFSNAYTIRDYYDPTIIRQQVLTNSLTETRDYSEQSTLNNLLTYETSTGSHSFNTLLGYSQVAYNYNLLSASRKDFYNNDVQSLSQGSLASRDNTGYESAWGLRSYFGRFNYNYAEKYFFELNARYDGSSRFTGKDRYSFFPSVSGAWRISKEKFWDNLSNIADEFKIRGSWGKTGNQSVGLYSYLETLSARDYNFGGSPVQGLYQATLANKDLTWETTVQSNIGLDASFLSGKLGLSFDYYKKKTEGILLYLPIPLSLGLDAPPQNAGNVENKGWELGVSYRSPAKSFRYNFAFNISNVTNKITNLAGSGPYIYNNFWVTTIQKEGLPINSFMGYKTAGFFQSEREVDDYPTLYPGTKPGDLKYVDVNKDGILNSDDMVPIGSDIPHFTFGMNMNFDYKNFDMNLFFQGVGKAEAMIGEAAGNIEWQSFVMDFEKDYWTPQNPNAKFPRPEAFADKNWVNSDFWIVNAAYLKLKNFQLGYTLPSSLTKRANIQRLRLYVAKSNVFTISKVNKWGMDPEFNTSMRQYPQVSLTTVGVSLTF
ncbi:SusC/RagA family TonB-linked outer membrane protein [Segetibacter koreensis]|uniref:SusC/RagA family TonB-linked outer membrane protein n=1 Tax=Segetibacter koreensis TaxID=398037 RepID=UPI00036DCF21|nr:TonB-dependent receptor [Segetibacter koreensis]